MKGMMVMFNQISGIPQKNQEILDKYIGSTITKIELVKDCIVITFDNNKQINIFDAGQSCCEHRYITCDDNLNSLVGEKLKHMQLKEMPSVENEDDEHEQAALEIATDKDFITFVTHNVHNGYYGGFSLVIEEENQEEAKPIS